MLKPIFLIFIFFVCLVQHAAAQEEDVICLGVAHNWVGDLEDVQNISRKPIPDSFRSAIEAKGCSRWQLVESSLLHWHYRFGSDATMSEASAYLVKHMLPTAKISANEPEKKAYYLNMMAATYYHMGAIAFESGSLLRTAEKYFTKAKREAEKLPVQEPNPGSFGSEIIGAITHLANDNTRALHRLSTDLIVARALISGQSPKPSDVATIFESIETSLATESIYLASDMLVPVCEDDRGDQSEAFLKACEESDHTIERDMTLAVTRAALLSNIVEPDNRDSGDLMYISDKMLRIAEAEYEVIGRRPVSDPYKLTRARLHVAHSDMYAKKAEGYDDKMGESQYDYADDLQSSLSHLLDAERYLPRYAFPSQWKRVADRYLERAELLERHNKKIANPFSRNSELKLRVDYFRSGLESLKNEN